LKNNQQSFIFQLFENIVPKTTENFLRLTLGTEKGSSGKLLSYKNTVFHRIIPGFAIQGGDVTKNNGTGKMMDPNKNYYLLYKEGSQFMGNTLKMKILV